MISLKAMSKIGKLSNISREIESSKGEDQSINAETMLPIVNRMTKGWVVKLDNDVNRNFIRGANATNKQKFIMKGSTSINRFAAGWHSMFPWERWIELMGKSSDSMSLTLFNWQNIHWLKSQSRSLH